MGKMKQVLVIGAGASGLMAGITAAKTGAAVTILEGTGKPGKKLLITGNGKCNLTNTDTRKACAYRGTDSHFVERIFEQFTVEDTMNLFRELGLLLKNKNGYIYPYVDQASAVLEVLLLECRRLKVKIKCTEKAEALWKDGERWKVKTATWIYEADAVILSAGSKTAPSTGSDGSGYELAASTGLRLIKPLPALVPLKARGDWYKKLSGVRSPARLTLSIDGEDILTEAGELQWTEFGISGIVTFQLSGFAVKAMEDGHTPVILADLMPDYTSEQLLAVLTERMEKMTDRTIEEMLNGMFHKKMIQVLIKLGDCSSLSSTQMTQEQLKRLVSVIKDCRIEISGVSQLTYAQVCQGGIETSQLNPETLESLLTSGLYLTGEMIDIDGACGGYNLQWAWSSGYVAGIHCAKEEDKNDSDFPD